MLARGGIVEHQLYREKPGASAVNQSKKNKIWPAHQVEKEASSIFLAAISGEKSLCIVGDRAFGVKAWRRGGKSAKNAAGRARYAFDDDICIVTMTVCRRCGIGVIYRLR